MQQFRIDFIRDHLGEDGFRVTIYNADTTQRPANYRKRDCTVKESASGLTAIEALAGVIEHLDLVGAIRQTLSE